MSMWYQKYFDKSLQTLPILISAIYMYAHITNQKAEEGFHLFTTIHIHLRLYIELKPVERYLSEVF